MMVLPQRDAVDSAPEKPRAKWDNHSNVYLRFSERRRQRFLGGENIRGHGASREKQGSC